jgi:hypothetical protein
MRYKDHARVEVEHLVGTNPLGTTSSFLGLQQVAELHTHLEVEDEIFQFTVKLIEFSSFTHQPVLVTFCRSSSSNCRSMNALHVLGRGLGINILVSVIETWSSAVTSCFQTN